MRHLGKLDYEIRPAFSNTRNHPGLCSSDLHPIIFGPAWTSGEVFTALVVEHKSKTHFTKVLHAIDVMLLASYYLRVGNILHMVEGFVDLGMLQLCTMAFFIQYSVDQAFPIRPRLYGWRKLVYTGNCLTLAAYIINYHFVPLGQKKVDAAITFVIQCTYRIFYFGPNRLWSEAYLLLQALLLVRALFDLI